MDLYFERHDGDAVTCDDFRAAMADANDSSVIRSEAFGRWYSQSGTPTLTVAKSEWDASRGIYEIILEQATPPTAGQSTKMPLLCPVAVGLLAAADGSKPGGKAAGELKVRLAGSAEAFTTSLVLAFGTARQSFALEVDPTTPVPGGDQQLTLSLLRGWSAPVKLVYPSQTFKDLALLMAADSDGFNRYEAASRFATRCLVSAADVLVHTPPAQRFAVDLFFEPKFVAAWVAVFQDAGFAKTGTQHLQAMMLRLPAEVEVLNEMSVYDPEAVHVARAALKKLLAAEAGTTALLKAYKAARVPPRNAYALTAVDEGRRALATTLLDLLSALGTPEAHAAIAAHHADATNHTDEVGALALLADCDCPQRRPALDTFEAKWRHHREVIDTWFSVQATSSLPEPAARLRALMQHEAFSYTKPNKVRAIFGLLAVSAPSVLFSHDVLELLREVIDTIDATNGNLSSSLAKMLQTWRKLPEPLRSKAKDVLEALRARPGCSKNLKEVATTALR